MTDFVQAKDLQHIRVKGCVHLWQVKNGQIKSFTNGKILQKIEELAEFNELKFWEEMAASQDDSLGNGFYFVNHDSKTANWIASESWSFEVQNELIRRGYIDVIKQKGFNRI